MTTQKRLGDILVEKGLATAEQINEAVRMQVGGNRRLGYILIKMGIITGEQLREVLSSQLDVPIIKIDDEFSSDVKRILPRYLCQKYTVAPVAKEANNVLALAMADPSDDTAIADIEAFTGMVVKPMLAREQDISAAINKHIPFTLRDVFNPFVYSRATRIITAIALILLCVVGVVTYRYVHAERYGTISRVGNTVTYKNHDLMLGVEGGKKISLLGHGAYSKGFYSVTFNSVDALETFLEQKRKNFSDKQYTWLRWVIDSHLKAKRK